MVEPTEWGVELLDLPAYLERIRCPGPFRPTAATLRRLHRAHLAAIAFENVDALLGRGIPLDLPAIQDKLVRRPRGGYCHEHNLLFAAVLQRLGFPVQRLLARPCHAWPGLARGHCTLLVEADGRTWLADVGYGGRGPLEPIPLRSGSALPRGIVRQGGWAYRLVHDGAAWVLHTAVPDGWTGLYAVVPFEFRQADFEMASYFTSTHPSSPFATGLIVQSNTETARYALRDLDLVVERPDGARRGQRLDPGDLPETLAAVFGIVLADDEADRLIHSPRFTGSATRPEKAA